MNINRKKTLIRSIIGFITLLLVIRLSLPYVIQHAFSSFFADQGVEARIGDVGLELIDGSITLTAISADRDAERVLEVASLVLSWSWSGLFDNEARVQEFLLDGLRLNARQLDADRLMIAGIDLSALASQQTGNGESDEQADEPVEWRAAVGHVRLSNSHLCYSSHVSAEMDYCTRYERIEWNGDVVFDLSQLAPGVLPLRVNGGIEIDALQVHNRSRDITVFELPSFAVNGIRVDTLENFGLERVALSGDVDACFGDFVSGEMRYCISFNSIQWDGSVDIKLADSSASKPMVNVDGNVNIESLRVSDQRIGRSLAELDKVSVEGLQIDSLDDISAQRIALHGARLMQRAADNGHQHITGLSALTLDGLRLETLDTLAVEKIVLEDQKLHLARNEDGEFEFSAWFPAEAAPAEAVATAADSAPQAPGKPFHYRIGELRYSTDEPLVYTDHSLPEPFTISVSAIELGLDNIDSQKPGQAVPVSFNAQVYEHGKVALDGTATVLADERSFDIDGRIDGLDLRKLSAYTRGTIGYSIKSGQLDSTITLKAKDDILDSKIGVELHQFALKALSNEDAKQMEQSMGFPLSTSLALLRDRDGSIRLEIPITGDLDNPDFDPGDVINKATSKAITAAVINYYTPYGLVLAADGLFSLATALRFDPIDFDAGSAELSDAARSRLDKYIDLLKDRPGVRLTLCGYTTLPDAASLLPARKVDKDGKLPPLQQQQRETLLSLGEARAAAVKRYLVSRDITADRLILCAPEHEDEDVPGRVELSI